MLEWLSAKVDISLEVRTNKVNSEGDYELGRSGVRRIIYILLPLLLMLTGCGSKVTEDYLVGGIWEEKVEYKDGEPVRSEERRVGKECSCGWASDAGKKKREQERET